MEIDSSADTPAAAVAAPSRSGARIVFPGDVLSVTAGAGGAGVRLGNGLVQASLVNRPGAASASASASSATSVSAAAGTAAASVPRGEAVVTKCGVLRSGGGPTTPSNALWVDNVQKRYQAAVDDLVLGVVVDTFGGESYKVDLGGSQPAVLPVLAFEGATRHNKPNLPLGALVYARVVLCARDCEVELSCTSPHFKKDWVTGQSLYGELAGGYAFNCSTRLARQLLSDDCYVLQCLGRSLAFELAIGCNGKVWVNSPSPLHTVLVANAILNSEGRSKEIVTAMVQKLMQAI
jgi:exosome complex component RRP40